MEISEEGNSLQKNWKPKLLMRLNMDNVNPSLLERMTMDDIGIDQFQMTILQERKATKMSGPWMKNQLISWTMLSKALGVRRSQNSKPYWTSSLSSTSTHLGQRRLRMSLSNTTCAHSMKSKLLLLQRLSEESTFNKDYNPLGGLYSPPGILPGIPLESRNSAGLIPEFDIPPDCGWNITRMIFYLLCLESLCRVPLDSVKIL